MTGLLLAAVLWGPIPCDVIRVVDGDTVEASCVVWVGTSVRTFIRLRGVDTPEKHGKCPSESALAIKASKFTTDALPRGTPIQLIAIEPDKYGGRVVAKVIYDSPTTHGLYLSDELLAAGLARAYDGGTKSSWCAP